MARRARGGAGMARRRRPPRWHLFLTAAVLVAAVGLYLYLQWLHWPRQSEPLAPAPAPAAPERPADPAALADSVYRRADAALAELGVWPELIRRSRAAEPGRSGGLVDRIAVRVPGDLPLLEVNLYLTRMVQALGGQVAGAIERQSGRQVELRFGLDHVETTVFALERDSRLVRRAGVIALVLQDVGGRAGDQALERLCRLPQGLNLAIQPGEEDIAGRDAERARAAGHHPLVQVPAQASRAADPDAIVPGQDGQTIRRLLRQALRRVPGAEGLCWPPGDWPASFAPAVEEVLEEARRQGLPVLRDGMPGVESPAPGPPVRLFSADLVIDTVDEAAAVEQKLWELAALAAQRGQAVGVGRGRAQTTAALEAVLPRLETRGFRFLALAQLPQ